MANVQIPTTQSKSIMKTYKIEIINLIKKAVLDEIFKALLQWSNWKLPILMHFNSPGSIRYRFKNFFKH
jgi:hypothetical protein